MDNHAVELLRYAVQCRNEYVPIGEAFDDWYGWHQEARKQAAIIIEETTKPA